MVQCLLYQNEWIKGKIRILVWQSCRDWKMATIRVVLADDHAVVCKGIRDFLQEDGDIEVIAEASDGEKVKALILDLHPDVAILDVRMPHATGIEVTGWVREQSLPVRVL